MNCTIYSLECPIEKRVVYIGSTISPLKTRLSQHYNGWSGSGVREWCKSLKRKNVRPTISALCTVSESKRNEREQYWISHFKQNGNLLLNKERANYIDPWSRSKSIVSIEIGTHRMRVIKDVAKKRKTSNTNILTEIVEQYIDRCLEAKKIL